MHEGGFFFQAFVYLSAAVIAVPVATKLGLGSVLGYLLAGVVIGPYGLALVGSEGADVMHFAEFGVVMMLFLVGLELEPSRLWRMRGPVLGLGGLQVVLTGLVGAGICLALGLALKPAAAVGMILALSSTAIVLQSLAEKGLLSTGAGQNAFAVLLFQDIAVIPMLALMPLLASYEVAGADDGHGHNWVSGLPTPVAAVVVLGAVVGIIVAGRFLVRPVFQQITRLRLREMLTVASLLLVVGIAILMTQVGLSPALGAFVAGVTLASSEYRHELESDIEPFKGLLLGLFFMAVGASMNFGLIGSQPMTIAGLVALLMAVKLGVLFGLGKAFGLGLDQRLIFSFALAQGGEFAFVLASFATGSGVLAADTAGILVAVVAVSMALTPLAMVLNERVLLPRVGTRERPDRPADEVDEHGQVIVAGYGRVGQIVARLLKANGVSATLLDFDADQVETVRKFGARVFYGDASRLDLLRAAGAGSARLLIIALDNHEKAAGLVETVRKHFPHLKVLVRVRNRGEAFTFLEMGVEEVYRETLDSALRMGVDALRAVGFRSYQAHRAARAFRRRDEENMRDIARIRHLGEEAVVSAAVRANEDLMATLQADVATEHRSEDHAWDLRARIEGSDRQT